MSAADSIFAARANTPAATWLDSRREKAMARFAAQGVPHRRMEAWKYTDLRGALDGVFESAQRLDDAAPRVAEFSDPFAEIIGPRLVLVNGYYEPSLSTFDHIPKDVEIVDLSKLDKNTPDWIRAHLGEDDSAFAGTSLGLMRGGIAIRVPKGVAIEKIVHLRFLNPDCGRVAQHVRVLIVLEGENGFTLLESHQGQGASARFSNIGFDMRIGPKGWTNHIRFQREGESTVHVTSLSAEVEKDSTYHLSQIDLGGRLSRLDLRAAMAGEESTLDLSGVAVLGGKSHSDLTTHVEHRAKSALSRQRVRQVLGGQARGVYQGKVSVAEGAIGADSNQHAKAMLLSEKAEADLKPELEILADDVKCAHGAAIGDIEPEMLFYLRARGIPESEARALLVHAFIEDALGGVLLEDVERAVLAEIESVLPSIVEAA